MYKLILTLATVALFALESRAEIVSATFTYQGELKVGNIIANGDYDFRFTLYDAEAGGLPLAPDFDVDDLAVDEGVFSTELDFGDGVYTGDQLWLEIGIRAGGDTGAFTPLAPRQKITAVPYALHSEMVAVSSIGSPEVLDNSITAADLASNSVGGSEIINFSIGSAEINATQVQTRVSGTCVDNEFAQAVNQDGSLVCGQAKSIETGNGAIQIRLSATSPGFIYQVPPGKVLLIEYIMFANYWNNQSEPKRIILRNGGSNIAGLVWDTDRTYSSSWNQLTVPLRLPPGVAIAVPFLNDGSFQAFLYGKLVDE